MSDALPLVLPVLTVLLLGLLFWFRQRRSRLAKSVVLGGENHPAIPRRIYKLSEVRHSKLAFRERHTEDKNKPMPLGAEAYHIPSDLWDV
jgi:hypothetical protein